MQKVTALTHFLGQEGLWSPDDTKEVSENRASELLKAGLVRVTDENGKSGVVTETTSDTPKKRTRKPAPKLETNVLQESLETK